MDAYQMFGLRRLSQCLREMSPEKFDMAHWSATANPDGNPEDLHACGTAGCVGGWSTLFFDRLRISRLSSFTSHTDLTCIGDSAKHSGYAAVALAWGVSKIEAEAICGSNRVYESPAHAADVIDALVEKYFIKA